MNAQRTQEMINVLKIAFYSGEDVEHCIKTLKRTFGPDVLINYPHEVEAAFDGVDKVLGHEYRAFTAHGHRGVVRSSLDNQMENIMRIKESKLRRIVRKVIKETHILKESGAYQYAEKLYYDQMINGGDYETLLDTLNSSYSIADLEAAKDAGTLSGVKALISDALEKAKMNESTRRYRFSKSRRNKSHRIIKEHLHSYKGKTKEKYMIRPFPEEAKKLKHWNEYKEEFKMVKDAIDGNYRKMTALSIDYPKMNTFNVDEDAMAYKHYGRMTAAEKYVYCRNELMYLWEDLIRLWGELDEELGIVDGFAGY